MKNNRYFMISIIGFFMLTISMSDVFSTCLNTGGGRPKIMIKKDRIKTRYQFIAYAIDMCKQHPEYQECRNTEIFTVTVPPNDSCMNNPSDSKCIKGVSVDSNMAFYVKLCNEDDQKQHFRQVYGLQGIKENCHRACDVGDEIGVKSYQVTLSACPSSCANLCFNICDYH